MIRKYPKPVLCSDFIENSFYKEQFLFKLNIVEEEKRITSDGIEISFSIDLTSNVLFSLIKNNVITPYYKIKTNHYSQMFACEIGDNLITHKINKDLLDKIDKIEITSYLVANCDFVLDTNAELIEEVSEYEFSYKKDELLAISNTETLNYTLTGKAFINISLAEQQEDKGLAFSSVNKQVIQIKVGPSWNNAYAKLSKKKYINDLLSPFLAFSAILYALEKAIHDNENTSKEKDWFKIIEQNFESDKYENLEDFICSMRENYDVDTMYQIVQSVLNNSLESKIVRAARRMQ